METVNDVVKRMLNKYVAKSSGLNQRKSAIKVPGCKFLDSLVDLLECWW
jgi:hypothetical protein